MEIANASRLPLALEKPEAIENIISRPVKQTFHGTWKSPITAQPRFS